MHFLMIIIVLGIYIIYVSLHKRKSVLAPVAHTAQHENQHPKNCTLWLKQKVQPSFYILCTKNKVTTLYREQRIPFFLPNNFVITKPPNYRIIRQLIAHVHCLWSKRSSKNKCPYSHVTNLFTTNQVYREPKITDMGQWGLEKGDLFRILVRQFFLSSKQKSLTFLLSLPKKCNNFLSLASCVQHWHFHGFFFRKVDCLLEKFQNEKYATFSFKTFCNFFGKAKNEYSMYVYWSTMYLFILLHVYHELNANISEEFQPFPLLVNLLFTAHLLVVNNFKNLQKEKNVYWIA